MPRTAKDFAEQNKDILLRRLTEDDFHKLTDGTVLFCITVGSGKNTPMEERQIRSVGYQLVVWTSPGSMGLGKICTVTLTQNGYAKIDDITLEDIQAGGTKLLYACKPLLANDRRSNYRWRIY